MRKHEDDFYIGYLKSAPSGLATVTRNRILFLLGIALMVGAGITALQSRFWPGVFEFGTYRDFEGIILERPYPTLLVERPEAEDSFPYSRYLLVNPFKFGADETVQGMNGQKVSLKGQLVFQDGKTMIEVAPDSVKPTGDSTEALSLPASDLGEHTLRGEIVDSKCYLGVMNPGNLKTHKACAIRCISGGIPPVFLVRQEEGAAVYLLMVDEEGNQVNEATLPYVAEPLEITGQVRQEGGMLILYADPETYIRL